MTSPHTDKARATGQGSSPLLGGRRLLAVAMNQVSDAPLAIACHRAGCYPSLSSFNHLRPGVFDAPAFLDELDRFIAATGSAEVLLSLAPFMISDRVLVGALAKRGVTHVEVFKWKTEQAAWSALLDRCTALSQALGWRFLFKVHRREDVLDPRARHVIFKGNDGAGRTDPEAGSLEENFGEIRRLRPDLPVIPSGGIATAAQVRQYLAAGAPAVGIGTLFAAAEESSLSHETKLGMIAAGQAQLQTLGATHHRALVFAPLARDDANYTESLRQGMAGTTSGSIFAGKGIDQVDRILPVREIVARLLADVPASAT